MNNDVGSDYGNQTRPIGEIPSGVRAREVASMICPADGTPLQMAERQGVEIDYCPQCRGVWLDRGELDKIIERSASQLPPGGYGPEHGPESDRYGQSEEDDEYTRDKYGRKRKRRSFLDDIFDFG